MGKIFEALERAQRERMGDESQPPLSIPLGMEKEMVLLYQQIDSLLPDSPRKVIQFIAAKEGEGTSTIVWEFARTVALVLGKSVFILDADEPIPQSDPFVGGPPADAGGSDPTSLVAVEKSIYQVDRSSLSVCLFAQHATFAQKHFYSPQIENFWENLRQRFDLVLIDSPSFASSPDGIAISRRVDGVVLVLEAEKTRWPVAENLKKQIQNNGGNVLGIAFNKRRYYIPEFLYKRI